MERGASWDLEGRFPEDKESIRKGSFDEKLSIIGLLTDRLMEEFRNYSKEQAVQKILFDSYPVYEDMERVYEIKFESYIIYQCRNESYTYWQKDEVRKGKYLIIFEKSRFLDYYESVIFDFDSDDWKSNRKHYGIYTENHIIDVIANKPPIITKMNSDLT